MTCTADHSSIQDLMASLPTSQGGIGRHKCAACAFEAGYSNGLVGNAISPDTAIAALPDGQAGAQRHKCAKSAYLKGFDIGSAVANSLVQYSGYNTGSAILKFRKNEKPLLAIFPIDSSFIVGVFQGTLSQYDMIVKYWKYDPIKNTWGYPKQPKHIHWVVDIMIKQEFSARIIKKFIQSMIREWDNGIIKHLSSPAERISFLDPKRVYRHLYIELQKYNPLPTRGEYPMSFLILIAELLMTQERTNYAKAFMFRNLLERFGKNDFYGIISTATHNGK